MYIANYRAITKIIFKSSILDTPRERIKWNSLKKQSRSVVFDSLRPHGPGSSIHGIFQARILEWVAISFSWRSFQSRDWTCVSCIGRRILYHRAIWEAHLIVYRVQTRSMGPRKTWNPKGGVSCSMSSYHYWMKESSEEQGRAMPEACHSSWHKVDNKHSIK